MNEVARSLPPVALGALGQVARTVSDLARSSAWYRDVLGLVPLYSYGTLAFFDCGGTRLLLTEKDEASPGESLLYFAVTDIEQCCRALSARGVRFRAPATRIFTAADGVEEWMAFFDDPDGRPLALMERRAGPALA